MKKQLTKYFVLLVLIALFAAPGIAAYLFYQNPSWLQANKVNKGALLNPPVFLPQLAGQDKWHIVLWMPKACDAACLHQLDVLARTRLALGRKLYQVDQWLLLEEATSSLSAKAQSLIKELDFHVAQVPAQGAFASTAQVFLADPNNYLILSYSASVHPDDVYKDLKLLLNTTENKNGALHAK